MRKINCGPASSVALIRQGATVQVVVRSTVEMGRQITLDALIDTGSQLTIIESSCLQGWAPLPIVGPGLFAGANAQFSSDILLAEIEIPALHMREVTGILVVDDLSGRSALLGRTQLRDCVMIYDGPKGSVQLRK